MICSRSALRVALSFFILSCIAGSLFFAQRDTLASLLKGRQSANRTVIPSNFPDPSIIQVGQTWYAFATAGAGHNVQVATSPDFATWTVLSDANPLTYTGDWATQDGQVWAPDVSELVRLSISGEMSAGSDLDQDDGTFVMYYSATPSGFTNYKCIGSAKSSSVLGPYTPQNASFACPTARGGAIDPDGFVDPATWLRYVLYKVDGNNLGSGPACHNTEGTIYPTPIMLQQVQDDGVTPVGDSVQLLDRSASDGPLIEAPTMFRSDEGYYFLFFSSNCFSTTLYDLSYAIAQNINGPYTKTSLPFLVTGDYNLTAPGSGDVNKQGTKLVFHGDVGNTDGSVRGMYAAEITAKGTNITLDCLL